MQATNPENTFKFIDLFAGIGGLRLPFSQMGGRCVFSSEWDYFSQKTYQANHGETPHGDITKISPKDIPKHDLLLAGFPCQSFSQAGKKRGFLDTRGTLFFYIANIVKHHRPQAILLENVKRLVTHDGGNTLNVIKNILENLGYSFFYKVLNAKDFGIPQNRERVYIVAFRNTQNFEFPKPKKTTVKVSNILQHVQDSNKYTLSDKLWEGHKRRKRGHTEKGNGFGYKLFTEESPYTSTLSARYYKDGSEILIGQEEKNPRKLTPREAARLMGFPDTFKLVCSDSQTYKQLGNSVCVPVVEELAKKIIPELNKTKKGRRRTPKKINLENLIPIKNLTLP